MFLHGIMGNSKNLSGFAQKLVQEISQISCLIFDLRNHGQSSRHWPPYSVSACAQDVVMAIKKLELKPQKLIGHSFGGKVAVLAADKLEGLEQVWLLDCSPSMTSHENPLENDSSLSVLEIIRRLSLVSWPVSSRKDLLEKLSQVGIKGAIAAWMTTNLESRSDGLYLVFEPHEVKAMILDFIKLDCWPILKGLRDRTSIHMVQAQYGGRISQDDEARFKELLLHQMGGFHRLENAGHFLHVDNPNGLIEILKENLNG